VKVKLRKLVKVQCRKFRLLLVAGTDSVLSSMFISGLPSVKLVTDWLIVCFIGCDCVYTSQLLSRLLRSKNPDDLIAANRLIKNMVKQVNSLTAILLSLYASII